MLLSDETLLLKINKESEGRKMSIDDIIALSNKLVSSNLSFTFNKVSSNPNVIYEIKRANCIGYSSLFNAIGNHLLKKNNLDDKYEFNHLVGELEFLGINIHQFIDMPFFKDHDFNQIKNKKTKETKFVDPSLRDYFMIDEVRSE